MLSRLVHAILGVRARRFSFSGRADSQDRMDQVDDVGGEKLRFRCVISISTRILTVA